MAGFDPNRPVGIGRFGSMADERFKWRLVTQLLGLPPIASAAASWPITSGATQNWPRATDNPRISLAYDFFRFVS